MGVRLRRLRSAIDVVALVALSLGALAATMQLAPVSRDLSRGAAVVFPPWTDAETALRNAVGAGGRFVRYGGVSFIAVAIPDDEHYAARAFAAGAWFVLDPQVLAGCIPFSSGRRGDEQS